MDHGLNTDAIAVVSACVVLWSLLSSRLESVDVSAPMFFLVVGLVSANGPWALLHLSLHSSTIRAVSEITLAVVLFADASRVNAKTLRAQAALPTRLLAIGLPLTIGAGFAVAAVLFSGAGLWVAAALGAIVAPTDAALGAPILQDERIPGWLRRALNVESGLNDGIATPFVNLFLAGALASESLHTSGVGAAAVDLIGGAGLGAGIGVLGAVMLAAAGRAGWSSATVRPLCPCALALFAYATAISADLNGFVAAFVAGIAFGTLTTESNEKELFGFVEDAGMLLSLLVWFAFGAAMVVPGFDAAGWREAVFAVLALTVVRMLPVALALIGSGLDRPTVAFIGWFGPRGLASVVFGLIAVDSLAPPEAHLVVGAVTLTVTFSVLAHGASASPLAELYGRTAAPDSGGHAEVPAQRLPTRRLASNERLLGLRGSRDDAP